MHGNAGNKLEGLSYASKIVKGGCNLCVFDFSGCGNSEGEFVTLGYKERNDLEAVIKHIRSNYKISNIGLWGRSMGAATAILYMAENPGNVCCSVLDSAFSNFKNIVSGMGSQFGF
jgi:alpha/beta superfamily hydrolase